MFWGDIWGRWGFWGDLGTSKGCPGAIYGGSWGDFEGPWGVLGGSKGDLGRSWERQEAQAPLD